MMQQTSSTKICAPCTPSAASHSERSSAKQVNVSIDDIIPFHHVATIVVIASVAILVFLLLIGWLSYRRQEPFLCICCIRRRASYGCSPRAGKVRDTSTVKKSGNDLENALDSTCASMASSISETHTPKQQFVSMNESSNPDPLDGQEYLPPIGHSLYYADLASFQPAGRLETVEEELCDYDIVPYLSENDRTLHSPSREKALPVIS